jgi:hypothetical protein
MSVYTVHEPPMRAADAVPDPERFAFVRDGFSIWAFLVAPLWMLWHRLWVVLLIYLVVAGGVEAAMTYAGVAAAAMFVVQLLISLLVGLEAGTLRRFTLGRRGWKNVGVVSGDNLEDSERRFFDALARDGGFKRSARTPSPAAAPLPRVAQTPDVVGLFPEPGANR